MSTIINPNAGPLIDPNNIGCSICRRDHSVMMPCKTDDLIQMVHFLKGANINLQEMNRKLAEANVETVKTAKEFQQIIANTAPEMKRLYSVEARYKKLSGPKKIAEATA